MMACPVWVGEGYLSDATGRATSLEAIERRLVPDYLNSSSGLLLSPFSAKRSNQANSL
jgi:hypothetical protein